MITKEVTLCGKQVILAYCYATEISYKILSDEDITDLIGEVIIAVQNKERMPDIRKSMYLILAAMQAYYDSKDDKSPVTDKNMMYDATSEEIGMALGTIIGLRAEFYHVPKGEPEDKPEKGGKKRKNV